MIRYYLCHMDVRCTKSVSVLTPVHYAIHCVSRGKPHVMQQNKNIFLFYRQTFASGSLTY